MGRESTHGYMSADAMHGWKQGIKDIKMKFSEFKLSGLSGRCTL